jgi:hypothetical protein
MDKEEYVRPDVVFVVDVMIETLDKYAQVLYLPHANEAVRDVILQLNHMLRNRKAPNHICITNIENLPLLPDSGTK